MTILEQLQDQSKLNASEQSIASFIITNKERVLHMPIQELAQSTFTSTSTIVRLCRKLGLKGFSDFKIQLSAELQIKNDSVANVDYDFPFNEDDSYNEIAANILGIARESMQLTQRQLRGGDLEVAVRLIRGARHVGIFADGDSYIRAESFANRLMKLGIHLLHSSLPGERNQLANTLGRGDCAIIVTYSGEGRDLHRVTQILNGNGVSLIVVTSNPTSHIGELAKVILPLVNKEDTSLRLATFSSQFAIEYVLDVLYSCIFVSDFERFKKMRARSEQLFRDQRYAEGE